jgi:DNA sulfur modification protein DndE
MFNSIKTSLANKDLVSTLTRKLNLGTENIVARIAYTYSLSHGQKLDVSQIKDSKGKEYSRNVLFGNHYDHYIALLSIHYNMHKTDKDIPKLVKMHIDDGLELIQNEIQKNPNLDGFEFLTEKIKL